MNFGAEEALRAGDPATALKQLQEAIRARPADARLRIFLAQLLCVLGQWDRALNQLDVCAQMDAAALPMREMYREAIACERLRAEVFKGNKSPMLFGEPEGWVALLIESLMREGRGEREAANRLRGDAFESAPAVAGTLNDQRFEWIADADMRLGPVLETIVNARYYWIPFNRLSRVDIEAPSDLRDFVWLPAHLQFSNGGESVGLIPTRYPGSEASDDGPIALARKTVWDEPSPDVYFGLGQRLIATDIGEHPVLDLRTLIMEPPAA